MDRKESDILVNIFEKDKKMRVIVEMPGLDEQDIMLDLVKDLLVISASQGSQDYYKSIRLPRLRENIIGKIYNNGTLEVTLC